MSAFLSFLERLLSIFENLVTELHQLNATAGRIADILAPMPGDIVGTPYVAKRLHVSTTWVSDLIRNGQIPPSCVVKGTGEGKPHKLYRAKVDKWIEDGRPAPNVA